MFTAGGAPPDALTRRKSQLTLAGERAQRALLLDTLEAQGWNLTRTAVALDLTAAADVVRSIKLLALSEEYDKAKAAGLVRPGRPKT